MYDGGGRRVKVLKTSLRRNKIYFHKSVEHTRRKSRV